jgi:hypothetical protein
MVEAGISCCYEGEEVESVNTQGRRNEFENSCWYWYCKDKDSRDWGLKISTTRATE